MSILSFFSKMLSTRPTETAAPAAPAAPAVPVVAEASAAPVAWKPNHTRRSRREAQRSQRSAPPSGQGKQQPQGAKPRPAMPAAPAMGRSEPAAAREAEARPAVAAVGARGETDLAPSQATFEGASYPSVEGSGADVDRAAIRELFSDIAAGQAGPIKTFIGDLQAKNATGEWLQVCRPLMAVLLESATSLGMDDAAAPMNEFISAMDLAAESLDGDDGPIDGAAREVILEAYGTLAKVFPEAFALGPAASRRDTMLLHALLKQVPGVGIVTFDALYGAGLTSVETLFQANPADLSSVTGIALPLCVGICAGLHEHQLEVQRSANLPADRRYSGRLTELLRALAREHDAFERVSEETGFDEARTERKRVSRRNRNLCALKIEATLIEMGEIDCADALRVLSFDRRIDHMEKFLGVRVTKRAAEHR